MALSLKIIIGSTRPGRAGPTIAKWVEEIAKGHGGFDIELVDLADLKLPFLDEAAHPAMQKYELEHTKRWSKIVDGADAFIFVTPEYDYFAPATLVNAIQLLLKEWHYKTAGVVSYGGISGGLRSAQVLRQLLGNVNLHAVPGTVPVPMFKQHIGEDGVFRDNEVIRDGLTKQLDELVKWATALKTIRPAKAADQRAA